MRDFGRRSKQQQMRVTKAMRWLGNADWQDRVTVMAVLLLTPFVRLSLRRGGFAATRRRLDRIRRRRDMSSSLQRTARTARLAGAVMRRIRLQPTCLERSLIVWWAIGGNEVCSIRLGVAPPDGERPLSFHAWVEVQGTVVNDRADIAEAYWPFPDSFTVSTDRFD